MQGKIIKGIAGFYYIHQNDIGICECKARGAFRNQKIKPLVGDFVEFDVIDEVEKKGNIVQVLPRKNQLVRPEVSNVDQVMVFFAAAQPAPNLNLLDRFLAMMEYQGVETIICFNKTDVVDDAQIDNLRSIYEGCSYQLLFTSIVLKDGLGQIMALLADKTTVLAGPSGVGKSTMMNYLKPEAMAQTGAISEKIARGRHTTRHSEIFHVGGHTYVMDTPGFTSLYINEIPAEALKGCFIEFDDYEGQCRFNGCVHVNEPDCAVKSALTKGMISRSRYDNYVNLYQELKAQRRY